jgi:hypothetical protein
MSIAKMSLAFMVLVFLTTLKCPAFGGANLRFDDANIGVLLEKALFLPKN